MDPHSRAAKKNTSNGNEVLPQDTTHLMQRPCYQRESPCRDPAGNRTTRRPLDYSKETQTAVVCHVSRSSGLAKTILQGTVKGRRRQGRQRKIWGCSIKEWTGLELAKSQRAVENREKWTKLVVKSPVAPQRPKRLRGRWRDDDNDDLRGWLGIKNQFVIWPWLTYATKQVQDVQVSCHIPPLWLWNMDPANWPWRKDSVF